jgi:hypothetical protein
MNHNLEPTQRSRKERVRAMFIVRTHTYTVVYFRLRFFTAPLLSCSSDRAHGHHACGNQTVCNWLEQRATPTKSGLPQVRRLTANDGIHRLLQAYCIATPRSDVGAVLL